MKVEKDRDDGESVSASSRQVCSENVEVWAPGQGPYLGVDVSEEEGKVSDGLEGKKRMQSSGSFRGTPLPNPGFVLSFYVCGT